MEEEYELEFKVVFRFSAETQKSAEKLAKKEIGNWWETTNCLESVELINIVKIEK